MEIGRDGVGLLTSFFVTIKMEKSSFINLKLWVFIFFLFMKIMSDICYTVAHLVRNN